MAAAQAVMDRLTAVETAVTELAARSTPVDPSDLRTEVAELRNQLQVLIAGGPRGDQLFQIKDLVPEVLGNEYREKWRTGHDADHRR